MDCRGETFLSTGMDKQYNKSYFPALAPVSPVTDCIEHEAFTSATDSSTQTVANSHCLCLVAT